jgi:DNA ligase D-like protein (predicted 3'-phosphoesterase)
MSDKLKKYSEKRDFRRTGEPRGEGKPRCRRRFVIQKHDASRLHYDLRLQVGDVLASWAVPKGPATDPSDKRLAIETEDHPVNYIDFEGVIPEGEYGAGTVLVWDQGEYRNLREEEDDGKDMQASLDDGLIKVWLEGEKLSGGYALKRIRDGDKPQWLLIKMDDEEADARRRPTSTEPESVKTGRDLEEIAEQKREKD